MKLNCLLTNISAVNDIKDGMIIYASEALKAKQSVAFKDMFAMIREQGLEIDVESAGYIYLEAFGDNISNQFTKRSEVESYATADAREKVNSIVDRILVAEPKVEEKVMGMQSEEKRIAKSFASMFDKKFLSNLDTKTESIIVQMGKAVETALKAKLPKDKSQKTTPLNELLENFFNIDSKEYERLDGSVNNLESLLDATKVEMDKMLDEITKQLPKHDAQMVRELWGNYFSEIKNASYDIMLGTANQTALLNQVLTNVKLNDKNIVGKNGDIAWSAISGDLDIDEVVDKMSKVFTEGFTDKTGKQVKYTQVQADRLAEYLGRVLERKVASYKVRQVANERTKSMSAKNVMSDFLKGAGFVSLRKDEQGVLSKTVSDWSEFVKYMERKGVSNKESSIDELKKYFKDYVQSLTDKDGKQLFTDPKKVDEVVEVFGRAIEDKMTPDTLTPNSIDKLIALSRLNGGNSFNETTQYAVNKLVGVSNLDQSTLNKLNRLAMLINVVSGIDIKGTPKTRGEFAFQSYSQIDRLIKEILTDYKQDKSATQKIVKTITAMSGSTVGSLLINPRNFLEGITTSLFGTMLSFLRMSVTNPKMFSKLMKQGGSSFWNGYASHVLGGAHGNIFAEQDLSIDVAQGERLRLRSFEKMKWNSVPNVLKNVGDSYSILFNTANRVLNNGFDAGFNEFLGKIRMYDSMYDSLKETWGKEKADEIMDTALSITPQQRKEIKDESFLIVDAMKANGLNPTAMDRRLIEKQMRNALYQEAIAGASVMDENAEQRSLAITKAIFTASQLTTKELLGKRKTSSEDFISQWAYNIITAGMIRWQSKIFEKAKKKELSGNLRGAGITELEGEFLRQGPNKFMGGAANWFILGLGATPIGFLQTRSLSKQMNELKVKNKDVGNAELMTDADSFIKYYHLKGLYKEVMTKAIMGTALMAMTALWMLKGNGDDDEYGFIENLLKTKDGRKLLGKEATTGMFIMAVLMAKNTETDFDGMDERLQAIAVQMGGARASALEQLIEDLKRSKTDSDKATALGSFMSKGLPSGNLNQAEQIKQFYDTFQSGITGDANDVLTNQEISKQQYKKMEGFVDGLMGNGMYQSALRMLGEEPYNRYSDESKEKKYIEFKDAKLIDLYGVGEKNLPELKKKGIQSVDDLMNKDKKELERLGFTEAQSIRLYNDLHLKGSGTTPITDLKITEDEVSILKRLGYNGIDASNKSDAITDIKNLKKKSSYSRNSEGDIKIKTDEESVQKVKEYNNILEQLQKVE